MREAIERRGAARGAMEAELNPFQIETFDFDNPHDFFDRQNWARLIADAEVPAHNIAALPSLLAQSFVFALATIWNLLERTTGGAAAAAQEDLRRAFQQVRRMRADANLDAAHNH